MARISRTAAEEETAPAAKEEVASVEVNETAPTVEEISLTAAEEETAPAALNESVRAAATKTALSSPTVETGVAPAPAPAPTPALVFTSLHHSARSPRQTTKLAVPSNIHLAVATAAAIANCYG